MEITLSFDGIKIELFLEELAKQKNVFGYRSIGDSVASALGFTFEDIMGNKNHPDFQRFIKARNIIVSDIWGW